MITRHEYEIAEGQTRFAVGFEFKPRMSKLIVTVDDVPAYGWDYEKETSSIVFTSPPRGDVLKIRRFTSVDEKFVVFVPSNLLDDKTNNWAFDQVIYKLQEESLETDEISKGIWSIQTALELAQEAAALANDRWIKISSIDWDHVAFTDRINTFTEPVFVPTAGVGTNTTQAINGEALQNELAFYAAISSTSFVANQWQLVNGKYRLTVVTNLSDILHVYIKETSSEMIIDDKVEIHRFSDHVEIVRDTAGFDGRLAMIGRREMPTYKFEPIRDGSGNIVSLMLAGIATNPANHTELYFPSSARYNGVDYPVTAIKDSAFIGQTKFTRIVIPEGYTIIYGSAFSGCTALSEVILPSTMREIRGYAFWNNAFSTIDLRNVRVLGNYVFSNNPNLIVLNLPASFETIYGNPQETITSYNQALTAINVDPANPNFTSVDGVLFTRDMKILISYPMNKNPGTYYAYTFPPQTEVVAVNAFAYNSWINAVNLANVQLIKTSAFYNMSFLAIVNLSAATIEIGDNNFADCLRLTAINVDPANPNFTSVDGILFTRDMKALRLYPVARPGTSYAMPEGVEILESRCFALSKFTTVILSSTLKTMRGKCFENASVSSLNIGAGATDIAEGFANNCPGLMQINVDPANPNFMSVDGVLFTRDMKMLVQYPAGRASTSYTAPDGVEILGQFCLGNSPHLTSVSSPDTIVEIRTYACALRNLTSFIFNNGLRVIHSGAFYLTRLTNAVLPATVTHVQGNAFQNIATLQTIQFNSPTTLITGNPIAGCPMSVIVKGYAGSTAQAFAKAYNYLFQEIAA